MGLFLSLHKCSNYFLSRLPVLLELAQSALSLKSVEWLKTISLRLVECPRSSFVKCYMKVYQNDVCTHSVSCRTWSGIASCQNSRDATCCVRESMRLRVKPARTRTYYMHPHARKRTMFKLSFPEKRWMDSNDKPKVGWMLLYGKCYLVTCYLLKKYIHPYLSSSSEGDGRLPCYRYLTFSISCARIYI